MLYRVLSTRLSITGLGSWVALVLPLLLSMTTFADAPILLVVVLSTLTFAISYLPRKESGTPLPSDRRTAANGDGSLPVITPLAALTTHRAHMMLMTVLAILAVDFPVFPRNLVKCETFGVSLVSPHALLGGYSRSDYCIDGHWRRLVRLFARSRFGHPSIEESSISRVSSRSQTTQYAKKGATSTCSRSCTRFGSKRDGVSG